MGSINIDSQWNENLEKIEGRGLPNIPNDNKDIMSLLIKALQNRDCLPDDLNNPESLEEAWAVDDFASTLNEIFSKGVQLTEAMMVGLQVEKEYNDIQDEKDNTRDMYDETGHKRSDF